jgi:hypothetical protein
MLVMNTKIGQFVMMEMWHSLAGDMWDNSKIWSVQWVRLFMAYNQPLLNSEDFANLNTRSRLSVPRLFTFKSPALDSTSEILITN